VRSQQRSAVRFSTHDAQASCSISTNKKGTPKRALFVLVEMGRIELPSEWVNPRASTVYSLSFDLNYQALGETKHQVVEFWEIQSVMKTARRTRASWLFHPRSRMRHQGSERHCGRRKVTRRREWTQTRERMGLVRLSLHVQMLEFWESLEQLSHCTRRKRLTVDA